MADSSTRRRVKLYMLNEDRQWDDRGTGHVSSAYVERLKGMSLIVRSETDGSILLESKIQPDTAYQKQQETLIVWSEADNYDLALSFQEKAGCDEIWEKICNVQGKDPSVEITQDIIEESEDERFDDMPEVAHPIDLPPCELSKLEEISELFCSVLTIPVRKEKLAVAIEQEGYIKKLLDLFHMCEDLENMEGLHHLYEIFKSIFLLNKNSLFEILFQEDTIFDVVGVLEYDPTLTKPAKHREYLQATAKFREVIPFTNQELVNKIHQTYRVQYIQDVILPTPSVFEENMLSTLTSFIFFNKVEIVGMVQDDELFLQQLFSQIQDDKVDDSRRRDLVFFLKEFCTFSQTLQPQGRETFFKTLSGLHILEAVEYILSLDDKVMKSPAIDIFSHIVEFSPSMVREFILKEGQKNDDDDLLINLVIEQMINDSDPELGGAVQLMGIMKLLIDPENMLATALIKSKFYNDSQLTISVSRSPKNRIEHVLISHGSATRYRSEMEMQKTEKTEFLSFFYKHSMHVLTAPLFAVTAEKKISKDDFQSAQLLSIILDLLTFCVEHHSYHIKNYIISKDVMSRVLVLLRSRHAFLILCALRLMRKIIGMKEEFYNRYIIKQNLFKHIVSAFTANGNKYNLLNSAMIELFEFIRLEDIKSLCNHIVEEHIKDLDNVDYVNTFKTLKLQYEQFQDKLKTKPGLESTTASLLRNNRFRRDQRTLEEEEEMWFANDDEVDDGESIVPMSDVLKNKLDADFDQINRLLENRRANKEQVDMKDAPVRFHGKNTLGNPINITLRSSPLLTSPVNSPERPSSPGSPGSPGRIGTPCPTPNTSPISPLINKEDKSASLQTKRPSGLVGLVDYPDEDSDEEDEENEAPSPKRARLVT